MPLFQKYPKVLGSFCWQAKKKKEQQQVKRKETNENLIGFGTEMRNYYLS